MSRIDVSGVLQNFAVTFTKLIGHGGKNRVVSYVCVCTKLHRAVQRPYGLIAPERSLRHAVAVTGGMKSKSHGRVPESSLQSWLQSWLQSRLAVCVSKSAGRGQS